MTEPVILSSQAGDLHETYLTDEHGPLPFCKGCGHSTIVKSLDQALVKLQVDPARTVIVTDIGCIGLCDRYFTTSAFHGLHGRSITYACGLKMARPELTVITLMGDGGCGIGGTHLLNVARRNIGITLIIGNNFNYGMTGGQHSVTTPVASTTSTTPWGNFERPLDLCATVGAAGAAWVRRATAFDKDLADVMVEAIRQPGFSMLDVWELCTAHFAPKNQFGRKDMLSMFDELDFETGLLKDQPRPEFSENYLSTIERSGTPRRVKPPIETSFTSTLDGQVGIMVAGSAGQKVRSTATVFAEGALFSGLTATQKDDYPVTVQSGHSISEIILSRAPILYTGIRSPEYLVALSDDGVSRMAETIRGLSPTSTIFAEESLGLPETRATVKRIPFSSVARSVGRLSVATAAFAAVLEDTGIYPLEAFAAAVQRAQKPEIASKNLAAIQAGQQLVA